MKKGFTLIELLGVIAVLGILAIIAIPIVDRSLNESREGLYETQIEQIIKGAEDYYTKNLDKLPQNDGDTNEITVKELQDAGFLPLDIKNPKTNENVSPNTTVIVTKNGNNYKYELDEETIEWKTFLLII